MANANSTPVRCYDYKRNREEIYPSTILPFTTFPRSESDKTPLRLWHVPSVDDYGIACRIGREYAAHFVQHMKDNPHEAGNNFLGHIAASINFDDESDAKGYWVGFSEHLERFIFMAAKHVDVFDDLDQLEASFAEQEEDNLELKQEAVKS